MAHQVALTIPARIKVGHVKALKELLATMSGDAARNAVLPFGSLPNVHFGRLVVVEECDPPILLLTMDCDAPVGQHLHDLVVVSGSGLDDLFSHCEDYPGGVVTADNRLRYLQDNLAGVDVFYVHAVGRPLRQILQEDQLRKAIEGFLDRSSPRVDPRTPLQVRDSVRAFLASDLTLAWALTAAQPPGLLFRVQETIHKIGVPLLVLAMSPILVPAVLAWIVLMRFHELTDPAPRIKLDPARLRALGDLEDFGVQNAISTLATLKPGWFWQLTSTIFFGIANYSSRHVFNNGDLSGLTTVHFARFMKLDGGRMVLFTSYYDGSVESYNNDFIDQVAWVLNGVFGNQLGYPRTRWLFFDGANDEKGFKAFLRGHEIPTQVWYSAYPDLAAVNVDNNAAIRAGLSGDLSADQAAEWLRRL